MKSLRLVQVREGRQCSLSQRDAAVVGRNGTIRPNFEVPALVIV
jgi:hypothetical protein